MANVKFCNHEIYNGEKNSYDDISSERNNHPSYVLRLRDLEDLLRRFKPEHVDSIEDLKSLDYGCGTGRPIRHLKKLGIKSVIGCDINEAMLNQARKSDPLGEYIKLELPQISEKSDQSLLPFENDTFDFVLSCVVAVETGSKEILQNMFNESGRVLKRGGIFFVIKAPKELYSLEANHKWKFFDQKFPENASITNSHQIKLRFLNMILTGFFWSDDYQIECCRKANLKHLYTHDVFGDDERDGIEWLDEKYVPVYKVLIFKKE